MLRRHGRIARVVGSLLTRWRHETPLYEQRVPAWDKRNAEGTIVERAILDVQYQNDDGRAGWTCLAATQQQATQPHCGWQPAGTAKLREEDSAKSTVGTLETG